MVVVLEGIYLIGADGFFQIRSITNVIIRYLGMQMGLAASSNNKVIITYLGKRKMMMTVHKW